MKKPIALICGTRPEIIKLAPVLFSLRRSALLEPIVIATGQHREMAKQCFDIFGFRPDHDLGLMRANQSPNTLLGDAVKSLDRLLSSLRPHATLIQGDTTTALAGSIASFHLKIPIGHVEAGLRTFNLHSPFPEEMNRTLISPITTFHFAPTSRASENLKRSGITDRVYVTGNTVVDAVRWVSSALDKGELRPDPAVADARDFILVTGHRRENFDEPIRNLCLALKRIASDSNGPEIIYPVHLNPNIQGPVHEILSGQERVRLLPPLDYPSTVFLLKNARLIVSDSGGIQEEAPSFGKYVLITRDTTERQELIESGGGKLIPLTSADGIYSAAISELKCPHRLDPRANPFGDGNAADQITNILEREIS